MGWTSVVAKGHPGHSSLAKNQDGQGHPMAEVTVVVKMSRVTEDEDVQGQGDRGGQHNWVDQDMRVTKDQESKGLVEVSTVVTCPWWPVARVSSDQELGWPRPGGGRPKH